MWRSKFVRNIIELLFKFILVHPSPKGLYLIPTPDIVDRKDINVNRLYNDKNFSIIQELLYHMYTQGIDCIRKVKNPTIIQITYKH